MHTLLFFQTSINSLLSTHHFLSSAHTHFSVIGAVVNIVEGGVASPPFNKYESLTNTTILKLIIAFLPRNLTFLPIRTNVGERSQGEGPLYYSISFLPLNESVAPAACPVPSLGQLQPNSSKSQTLFVSISLCCFVHTMLCCLWLMVQT